MFEDVDLYDVVKLLGVFVVALVVINAFEHLFTRLTAGEFAWDAGGMLSVLVLAALAVAMGVQFTRGRSSD